MLLSILVLVLFQGFWLHKVYQEQYAFLQQNADNIFRNTVFSLQDSLIEVKLSPLKKQFGVLKQKQKPSIVRYDTVVQARQTLPKAIVKKDFTFSSMTLRQDSLPKQLMYGTLRPTDTTISMGRGLSPTHGTIRIMVRSNDSTFKRLPDSLKATNFQNSQIQVFLSNKIQDTNVTKLLRPILTRIPTEVRADRKPSTVVLRYESKPRVASKEQFTIQLDADSIRLNDLRAVFARNLAKEQIPVSFGLQRVAPQQLSKLAGQMLSSPIPAMLPGNSCYVANFSEYQPYLLRKIAPHGLFSLFLIALTGLSFWLIYQNLRQQQRLTELKNDFISNVTHELKTPITTVGVAIEALSNFNVLHNPTQTQEYLTISKNELNRLSMLVDKVLKMAIFEQQAPDLTLEPLDVSELTSQILDSMKLQFERCKAHVAFECVGTYFTVEADRIHLTNVVYNLLENALKYSPDTPQIGVKVTESDDTIRLSIQDNGVGIPAIYQKKIFEKFFRVPTGDVHNVKGHGLGLSYVASVIAQQKGHIEVHSEVGKGSEFVVVLTKA